MITTETPDRKPTGAFSRIEQPTAPISPMVVMPRILAAKRPAPPTRNLLAGPEPTGLFARVKAWFRGEI